MNLKHIIAVLLPLVVVLCSCQQNEVPAPPSNQYDINLQASIQSSQTRVAQPSDNRYVFESGDSIQVVGWTGDALSYPQPWSTPTERWWVNSLNVFNGRKWVATPYMRWQNGEGLMHHFVSWWPASLATASSTNLTALVHEVSADYNPDILVASTSLQRPADNTLALTFNHLLARFDVHLHFTEHYAQVDDISLTTDVALNATLNLITGTVATGTTTGTMPLQSMQPAVDAYWSGSQIIIPQSLVNVPISISFSENGTQRNLTYVHPKLTFQLGKRTRLTLLVSKDEIKPIEVSVGDWVDSPSLGDADAEESTP